MERVNIKDELIILKEYLEKYIENQNNFRHLMEILDKSCQFEKINNPEAGLIQILKENYRKVELDEAIGKINLLLAQLERDKTIVAEALRRLDVQDRLESFEDFPIQAKPKKAPEPEPEPELEETEDDLDFPNLAGLSISEQSKARGRTIKTVSGTAIKSKVLKTFNEVKDRDINYIVNVFFKKWYPNAKKCSREVYCRNYYKHIGREDITISNIQNASGKKTKKQLGINKDFPIGEKIALVDTTPIYSGVLEAIGETKKDKDIKRVIKKVYPNKSTAKRYYSYYKQFFKNPEEYMLKNKKMPKLKVQKRQKVFEIPLRGTYSLGPDIEDEDAYYLNRTYGTTLKQKRLEVILKTLNSTVMNAEQISKKTGIPKHPTKAHLRYADIKGLVKHLGKGNYRVKKDKTEQTKLSKTERTSKELQREIPRKDEVATSLYEKYGIVITDEKYLKIINHLDKAWNHSASLEKLVEVTKFDKQVVYVHLLYGQATNKIVRKGDKFILKTHYDKLHPFKAKSDEKESMFKNGKYKSKSWVKE